MSFEEASFYSKLVRLKVDADKFVSPQTLKFLFQIGSIKRSLGFSYVVMRADVSIPNWFD